MSLSLFLLSLVVYTVVGLTSECVFTGFSHQMKRLFRSEPIDWTLPAHSYLWAPLVYGLSAALSLNLIGLIWPEFFRLDWLIRGLAYMTGIFAWEFVWGFLIEKIFGLCPWQYRKSSWRVLRYVNPTYAPFWFGFGFILEWVHLALLPALSGCL